MKSESDQATTVSQSGGLDARYATLSDEEALALSAEHFGLTGTLTRFATEKDDTFRLDSADGQQYVLKIANPFEQRDELALQVDLLKHIEATAPHLPVPRVYADRHGQLLPRVTTSAADERLVRLMSFLPGTPLDKTRADAGQRQRIGRLLGELRHATAGFSHPADSRVVAWDVKHLGGLRPLLAHVSDASQRESLEAALSKFHRIESRLAACRTQVLHNDFNTSNIVVDAGHPDFVTGIIDFGDAVRTAIAVDVSTAVMNQLPRDFSADSDADLFDHARDVLRGYLRVADLTAEELALIPFLAMGRVVTRALVSTWRAQLFPQNSAYILRHTAPGWNHLQWFTRRSDEELADTLTEFAS